MKSEAENLIQPNRAVLERRGRMLAFFTVGWNSLEAVVAIGAGVLAGSVALVGFGFDSVIESLSGAVIVWRLFAGEHREQLALRLVGASLLLLGAYVAFDAVKSLWFRESPDESPVGMALALASLVVMPLLAREKRIVAAELGSRAMHADSRQTEICFYLSIILFLGLGCNAVAGWWWADPVAALVMIPLIFKEGTDALRGKTCCANACH
jgi:divalent metal cation (Fe/Co/Zn/Cd) transporter